MKIDLSVIIPARNEMFTARTVQDILANIEGNTEIIVVCDGNWPDPPIEDNPKVHLIYHSESVGQRAATNEAVAMSRARYIMKVDAHCSFDKGFDVKMMSVMQDNWTMAPIMRNLHAFDWVCEEGHRRYQGPTGPCTTCGKPTTMDIKWIGKNNPQSTSYCFDTEPHFQYFTDFKKRPEGKGDITESMSLQGSCFMMTRDKYIELDVCDEAFGSWGSQGIEVAVKTWLSGGFVMINHQTWYAHMFRTQGGDFGFPWPCSGRQVSRAKHYARDLFFNNKWPKQVRPLSWLLERFWPVPGWKEDDLKKLKETPMEVPPMEMIPPTEMIVENKPEVIVAQPRELKIGMLYYTDSELDERISSVVCKNLERICNGHELVSVSLKPLALGKNIHMDLRRSHLTMAKQQLKGLENMDADIVFMVEHDIIYPKCHFDFIPPRKDVFYYNLNWWKVRVEDGQSLHFKAKQVSGLCAYRDILLEYYRNRVRLIESGKIGGRRHFEPGGNKYRDDYAQLTPHGFETWMSEIPYVDIRHKQVVTRNIFDPSGYRNQVVDWTMADEIPMWGKTKGRFWEFLDEVLRNDNL